MLSYRIRHARLLHVRDVFKQATVDHPVVKFIFIVLLLVLAFPYMDFVHIPTPDIDNSWRIALEYIYHKKLIWGKDVLFTYGPLGRWLQRYTIVTSPLELMLVDTFFALNLAVLLYSFLPKPLKVWHLCLYFLLWNILNNMHGEWIHFIWFYSVLYWGIRYLSKPSDGLLAYLFVLGSINFFMKANYGVIIIVFILSLLSYRYFRRQVTLAWFASSVLLLMALLLLGAYLLRVDLIRYSLSSLHIISGYNDALFLFPPYRMRLIAFSYGSFGLQAVTVGVYGYFVIRKSQRSRQEPLDTLFTLLWTLVVGFVLLKYAFTRADDGHITVFIKQSSLLLLLVALLVKEEWVTKLYFLYLGLHCIFYLLFCVPIFGKMPVNYIDLFSYKAQLVVNYFQKAKRCQYESPKATVPEQIRNRIGRQTLDVIPNELSEVYFNGFNYNPRPTLQSYQAYNAYLDGKNREKYLSESGSEWIMFSYESIDNKYPLADETQTLLAVLQRYQVAENTPKHLFLKRTSRTKQLKLVANKVLPVRMGEKVRLDEADSLLHVIYVKPQYTFYGQALKALFQPPQLSMTIAAEDNSVATYRAIPPLLAKGMIVNARIDNLREAKEFLETLQVKNKRVTGIQFDQKVTYQPGFEPTMEVTIQSYLLE
ncbi:hypothetical protein GCM10027347_56780 [Larkinella harenae]